MEIHWEVNIDKTKVCAFGKKPRLLSPFAFEGINLEMVQTYKYLRVWLSTNCICNKARQAQAMQPREESDICTTKITCKVKVPTHHHCTEVIWCYDTASTILRLWTMGSHSGSRAGGNRNAFSNLNLLPSATNMAICGELGQLPLHLLWRERILSRIDTAQRRFQISSERPFIYPLGCIKQVKPPG